LLLFGLGPIALFWLAAPHLLRRYKGTLLVIVILILMVSIPWEIAAVDRLWFYSPGVIWGVKMFNLPVEELAFFVIDGLLVGTLALWLGEKFRGRP
jgi:lycopene cyclase domain-containing protein